MNIGRRESGVEGEEGPAQRRRGRGRINHEGEEGEKGGEED
jgi:hypothetical protein